MAIRVILVEPLYQQNIGYAARVLKNFGVSEMNLVRPRCNHRGKDAVKYSKHAVDLLRGANVYRSLREATKGCDIVIGTTGQWFKTGPAFHNVYASENLPRLAKGKNAALLIGRDDLGLTKEELRECDATVFVPTNRDYPVLNISHALAILLYELHKKDERLPEHLYSNKRSRDNLVRLFEGSIKNRKDIRDKRSVVMSFRHMVNRADPTQRELNALSVGFTPHALKGAKTKSKKK